MKIRDRWRKGAERGGLLLRRVELCLWVAGILALGYCAYIFLEARFHQASRSRELDQALASKPETPVPSPVPTPPEPGSSIGRLEIDRVGVSTIVLEGSDARTLRLGVGHLPGTALPGQPGKVVLAGHRDTFFRSLRGIRKNDKITLTTVQMTHHYVVESTEIVDPDNTEVLRASPSPTLTLVTCYPFYYVGHAPKRFVVQAREVSAEQAAQAAGVASSAEPRPPRAPVKRRRVARPMRRPTPAAELAYLQLPSTKEPPETPEPKLQPEPAGLLHDDDSAPRARAKGIRRLNPVRLFGKLGRVIRRPEQPGLWKNDGSAY